MFTILTVTTVVLNKSKRTLLEELHNILKAKMEEQPVICEEIAQLQDSLKSSSPTIDVGENTTGNNCVRILHEHSCTYDHELFYVAL